MTTVLNSGTVSDEENPGLPRRITAMVAMAATATSAASRILPEKPAAFALVTLR